MGKPAKGTGSEWWTNPLPFWDMVEKSEEGGDEASKELVEQLRESGLTIWKGDLNYRRLTGDLRWPSTTRFADAIGEETLGF
jgi:hypothetical protein